MEDILLQDLLVRLAVLVTFYFAALNIIGIFQKWVNVALNGSFLLNAEQVSGNASGPKRNVPVRERRERGVSLRSLGFQN